MEISSILLTINEHFNAFGNLLSSGPILNDINVDVTNKGLESVGAGLATTGCLGAGIGQGFSAGKANEALSRNPEMLRKIQTTFIIGAAIAESGAIYSLLVALILLFVG